MPEGQGGRQGGGRGSGQGQPRGPGVSRERKPRGTEKTQLAIRKAFVDAGITPFMDGK